MPVLSGDIITGAQELANLADADFIAPATWLRWLNQSISALFKKIVVFNPDFFLSHVDYSSDGTTNNPFTPPSDFGIARGLTKDPTQIRTRRSVRSHNFSARDQQSQLSYRVDGGLVYLESALPVSANLRLWYDGKPITLVLAPDPDVTVRAASAADLSIANPSAAWHPSPLDPNTMFMDGGGGAGGAPLVDGVPIGLNGLSGDTILVRHGAAATAPTFTARLVRTTALPGTVLYAPAPVFGTTLSRLSSDPGYAVLSVDGVTPVLNDVLLIAGQVNAIQNGLYRVAENDPGGWILVRVDLGSPPAATVAEYNAAFAEFGARITVTDGSVYFGKTFRLTSGVGVDSAPLTFVLGIIPGKGLWLCGGRGEDGHLYFARMVEAQNAALVPRGLLVQASQGTANAGAIFSSEGDADTIGGWLVGASDVDFDLFTDTDVLPTLYEPFVEWLEVRLAIRGLGKEENDVAKDLKERLGDTNPPTGLTQEIQDYVNALNSGDGIAVTDVEVDADGSPWGWPWSR